MAGGLVVGAIGVGLLVGAGGASGMAFVVAGQVLFFLGGSPLLVLGTDLVVGSAPPERAGAASALSETVQEFGGALGMAVFGTIAAAVYRARMAVPEGLPAEVGEQARDTLGGAVAVAERLPDPAATALLTAARDAFTGSLQITGMVGAAVVAVTAALAAVLLRPVPARVPEREKAEQPT
jgi:DHA2 family multidrug resistance protein-like MFS transporter